MLDISSRIFICLAQSSTLHDNLTNRCLSVENTQKCLTVSKIHVFLDIEITLMSGRYSKCLVELSWTTCLPLHEAFSYQWSISNSIIQCQDLSLVLSLYIRDISLRNMFVTHAAGLSLVLLMPGGGRLMGNGD